MKIDPKKILENRLIEYLAVDRSFSILENSLGVSRFTDCPEEVKLGGDVRLVFPELIGLEEVLSEIFQGKQLSFELKEICRCQEQIYPLYFDLYFVLNEDNRLIIIVEEATERLIRTQKIGQVANECTLLADKLSADKDYLELVITSIKDVLFVTDGLGKIKRVNRATVELFGYTEEEFIDSNLSILLEKDDFSNLIQGRDLETICKTKTGAKLYIDFSSSEIHLGEENRPDFVIIGRDLTQRKQTEIELRQQGKRDRWLNALALRICQSLNLQEITNITVQQVRQMLECDRVIIYRFLPCWKGEVIAESVTDVCDRMLGKIVDDPCWGENHLFCYLKREICKIDDINAKVMDLDRVNLLAKFKVRAELAMPISINNLYLNTDTQILFQGSLSSSNLKIQSQLWGLLVVHSCQTPRKWEQWEIDLLQKLTKHLGIAIGQSELFDALQASSSKFSG